MSVSPFKNNTNCIVFVIIQKYTNIFTEKDSYQNIKNNFKIQSCIFENTLFCFPLVCMLSVFVLYNNVEIFKSFS